MALPGLRMMDYLEGSPQDGSEEQFMRDVFDDSGVDPLTGQPLQQRATFGAGSAAGGVGTGFGVGFGAGSKIVGAGGGAAEGWRVVGDTGEFRRLSKAPSWWEPSFENEKCRGVDLRRGTRVAAAIFTGGAELPSSTERTVARNSSDASRGRDDRDDDHGGGPSRLTTAAWVSTLVRGRIGGEEVLWFASRAAAAAALFCLLRDALTGRRRSQRRRGPRSVDGAGAALLHAQPTHSSCACSDEGSPAAASTATTMEAAAAAQAQGRTPWQEAAAASSALARALARAAASSCTNFCASPCGDGVGCGSELPPMRAHVSALGFALGSTVARLRVASTEALHIVRAAAAWAAACLSSACGYFGEPLSRTVRGSFAEAFDMDSLQPAGPHRPLPPPAWEPQEAS